MVGRCGRVTRMRRRSLLKRWIVASSKEVWEGKIGWIAGTERKRFGGCESWDS